MNTTTYTVINNTTTGTQLVSAESAWTYNPSDFSTIYATSASAVSIFPLEEVPGISHDEEMKLREENIFVKELYEQYKVALILAHGND